MNIDNVIEKVTKEIRRKYTDCIFNITHETMMGKEYLYIDVQKNINQWSFSRKRINARKDLLQIAS